VAGDGTFTAEHDATLLRFWGRAPARPESKGARVRMPRQSVKISAAGARSTILPRYITATSSAMWRTTARSCAMKQVREPAFAPWRSASRFRTCAWTEDVESADGARRTRIELRLRPTGARARLPTRLPLAARTARAGSASRRPHRARPHRAARRPSPPGPWISSGSRSVSCHRHARVERAVRILKDDLPMRRRRSGAQRAPESSAKDVTSLRTAPCHPSLPAVAALYGRPFVLA